MAKNLNKTTKVLFYIISKLKGNLGRTKLIKIAYLSDYISRIFDGHPITYFDYILWDHGPFDFKFYNEIKSLEANNLIKENKEEQGGANYEILGNIENTELQTNEKFIVDSVVDKFGYLPLDILLDEIVYKTEPARKAREIGIKGTTLDMEDYNNLYKDKFGIDFDTYLASIEARKRGERTPFDELINAL